MEFPFPGHVWERKPVWDNGLWVLVLRDSHLFLLAACPQSHSRFHLQATTHAHFRVGSVFFPPHCMIFGRSSALTLSQQHTSKELWEHFREWRVGGLGFINHQEKERNGVSSAFPPREAGKLTTCQLFPKDCAVFSCYKRESPTIYTLPLSGL